MVDAMIVLFESSATQFTTNGLGNLPDAISCTVVEERNGEFELEMEYPITGKRYDELSLRRIIVAKPNPYADPQPFRIYSMTKPINGIVTVNAEHISYDLSGYPAAPFTADSVVDAFVNMKNASPVGCPFTFITDKTTLASMSVMKPSSMRSLLGGVEGSILDVYGGEYEFDKFTVRLWNNRGSNRGVSIRYGKNLTDLKQEESCSSVYTGVYPFWYSEQDGLVQLSEKVLNAEGTYNFTRIYPLDLSQEWQDKPTEAQLRSRATTYMTANRIGIPKVSLTVSFIQLAQSEEYKNYSLLEEVHLCDTVNVEFPELNVSATAKCISTTYDVLTGKYAEIELGDTKSNLASTISEQTQAIEKTPTKTFMEQAIENATQLITGGLGGYVVMRSSSGGQFPDEILIMNTDSIETATKVWRWNKNGLGYSDTGYNGPYATAITADGQIVADFIAAGTLNGALIEAGTVSAQALSVEYKNSVQNKIDQLSEETKSSLQVNANAISSEVSRAQQAEANLRNSISGVNSSLSSKITQTASQINSQVSQKVGNNEIISKINQSAETVSIKASKISLEGIVTANSNFKVLSDGSIETKNGKFTGTITGAIIQNADSGRRALIDQSSALKGCNGNTVYNIVDMASGNGDFQMIIDAKNMLAIRTPRLAVINSSYGTGGGTAKITKNGATRFVSHVEKNMQGCTEMTVNGVYCTLPVFLSVQYTNLDVVNGMQITGETTYTSKV